MRNPYKLKKKRIIFLKSFTVNKLTLKQGIKPPILNTES